MNKSAQRLLAAALLLGAVLMVTRAWVSEDAFITFRTVDNFSAGLGLRWNTVERVQAYTNPLWMMLHVPFALVTDNLWLVSILLSFACVAAALALLLHKTALSAETKLCGLVLPLLCSRAFMDYTSSGLENPLSYLLLAAFIRLLWRPPGRAFWWLLGLIPALAMVNRLDTALIYAPPVLVVLWSRRREIAWGPLIVGGLPLLCWELFSLFYYGFPFPNTKYAKLNTGIDGTDALVQGARYLLDFVIRDTPGALILTAALLAALIAPCPRRPLLARAFGLSLLLHVAYVVAVGGDFMSGRFFSLAVPAAAWLCATSMEGSSRRLQVFWPLLLLVLLPCSIRAGSWWQQRAEPRWEAHGITDERVFYHKALALFPPDDWLPRRRHSLPKTIERDIASANTLEPGSVFVKDTIGIFGYYLGPEITVVDKLALSDPLLARLPIVDKHHWRVGHYQRRIPKGYLQAAKNGDVSAMPERLAQYTRRLQQITRGPLFSPQRLRTVLAMNLGRYDHLIDEHFEQTTADALCQYVALFNPGEADATAATPNGPITLSPQGMRLIPAEAPATGASEPVTLDLSGTGLSAQILTLNETRPRDERAPTIRLIGQTAPQGERTKALVIPWFANGGEFEGELELINTGEAQTLILAARRFNDEPVYRELAVPKERSSRFRAAQLFPQLKGGFSLTFARLPGVTVTWRTNSRHLSTENPMPFSPVDSYRANHLAGLELRGERTSVVTVVNLGEAPADITCRFYDRDGQPIYTHTIKAAPPLHPRALTLHHLLKGHPGDLSLRLESAAPVTACGFIFTPGYQPTTVPAQ